MSDEALLIGGQEAPAPQGSTGIQVPKEFVNVSIFGVFKATGNTKNVDEKTGDEYVEQKLVPVGRPKGTPDEDVAQFVFLKAMQQASLRIVGSAGEVNFYPLDMFKRFVVKISQVIGVTV